MSVVIEDLDVLVPSDKQFKLGNIVYALPADMPMELYLRIQRASRDDVEEEDATIILYDAVFDLFCHRLAEDDVEGRKQLKKTLDSLGVRFFMKLFSVIYKEDEAEVDADPTSPPTLTLVENGTASTTQPTPTPAA